MKLPMIVAHADWGSASRKRWLACAKLDRATGVYLVTAPELVGDASALLGRLARQAGGQGPVFVGFDFPIGLPLAYAKGAGIASFPHLLPDLGRGKWTDFYRVAERPDQISLQRPFYPQRPGGTSQAHLVAALGVPDMHDLLRICERKSDTRNAACSLFWTLGGNQVGKAAISGWRDVLGPALRDKTLDVALWPFEGTLERLSAGREIIIAETYPTEFYGHLGISLKGSKRERTSRLPQARAFDAWQRQPQVATLVRYARCAQDAIDDGFGDEKDGEDRFDAFVGLVGMLNVAFGMRSAGWPSDPAERAVEGWILGQVTG